MGKLTLRLLRFDGIDPRHKRQAAALTKLRTLKARLIDYADNEDGRERRTYETQPIRVPLARWTRPAVKTRRMPQRKEPAEIVYMQRWKAALAATIERESEQARERALTNQYDEEWLKWTRACRSWHPCPDPIANQEDRIQGLAAAQMLGQGVALRRLPALTLSAIPKKKGERTMKNALVEDAQGELREIYELAARLLAGGGGPEHLRILDSGRPTSLAPCYGRAGLSVILDDHHYEPAPAMAVAGFVLFGLDWSEPFKQLGIRGDLEEAFHELARRFSGRTQIASRNGARRNLAAPKHAALITIPKPTITHAHAEVGAPELPTPRRVRLSRTERIALPEPARN